MNDYIATRVDIEDSVIMDKVNCVIKNDGARRTAAVSSGHAKTVTVGRDCQLRPVARKDTVRTKASHATTVK